YRLSVFPLEVPALRERLEDLPALATHFVRDAARRLGVPAPRLLKADIRELQAYDWPGNVRELQNAIERAVILARDGRLRFDLPRRSIGQGERLQPVAGDHEEAGRVLSLDQLAVRE